MKTRSIFFILAFFSIGFAFSQTGTIAGTVFDEDGEPMMGATVALDTAGGAYTDLDGKFSLEGVSTGKHTISVSYVSYETKIIKDVEVKDGKAIDLQIKMLVEGTDDIEEVVIEAKMLKNTESSIITMQRKSAIVMDGIASQQFKKMGNNNAASAVKNVSGVSIEGGKYVYIRGLGDRYSQTLLNGSEIPSLDPEKNAVQLDIFPTGIIDNMMVLKTFSPDYPANFAGGIVNISTLEFPDEKIIKFSTSFSYNTQASFQSEVQSYEGGSMDWLGFDNGTRDVPDLIKNASSKYTLPNFGSAITNQSVRDTLSQVTKGFGSTMYLTGQKTFPLNHKHSFVFANKYKLFKKDFGVIASLNYMRTYQYYTDGQANRYQLTGDVDKTDILNPIYEFNDQQHVMNVLWGGLVNLSMKLNSANKLSFNYMYNRSAKKYARYQDGHFYSDDPDLFREDRILGFTERSINMFQLMGEHSIGENGKFNIKWITAATFSTQKEPDLRFFSNDYVQNDQGQNIYSISANLYKEPGRFFRDLEQKNYDTKVHLTYKFTDKFKLKTGASYLFKHRIFDEDRYQYETQFSTVSIASNINFTPVTFFAANNLGYNPDSGIVIQDASEKRNDYEGFQAVTSAYLMADFKVTQLLRVITGARIEHTDIEVTSADVSLPQGLLLATDILPTINIIYALGEKVNLRLGFSQTLARPTFREISPFSSYNFSADYPLVGNDSLERTNISNYDIRLEWYPDLGDMLAISGFYKDLKNPIERTFSAEAANGEVNFTNVAKASVFGVEIDVKKHLGFISPTLYNLRVGLNMTFTKSVVDIPEQLLVVKRANDPGVETSRPLFMQSPYLINANLSYRHDSAGFEAMVFFNVFGKRLAQISQDATPDIYETPRPNLGLFIRKSFGKSQKASIYTRFSNILNPAYKMSHTYKDKEYIVSSYKLGQNISLGFSYSF